MKLIFTSLFFVIIGLLVSCEDKKLNEEKEADIEFIDIQFDKARAGMNHIEVSLPIVNLIIEESNKKLIDSFMLKGYSLKSTIYGRAKKNDSAIYIAQILRNKADSLNDNYYLGRAYYKIGYYNYRRNNWHDSFENYVKSKEVFEEMGDSLEIAKRLLNMAFVQINIGDYLGAEETAIDGLKFLGKSEDKTKYKLQDALATAKLNQGDLKSAMDYRNKAIKSFTNGRKLSRRDSLSLLRYKNNKALIYIEEEKFVQGYNLLNNIINWGILRDSTYLNERARVIGNLGKLKMRSGDDEAWSLLKKSYQLRDSIGDNLGLSASLKSITEYYSRKKMYDSALFWGNLAFKNAREIKSLIGEKEALEDIFSINEEQNISGKSFGEKIKFQRLLSITDSLKILGSEVRNMYGEQKYRAEQHKIEALENKSDADRHKFLAILASILGIALVSLIMVYYYYANKAKKERFKKDTAREVYNTEIRLSKKVHDELANDMYAVMTQLQHQTNEVELEALLDKLEVIYERSRDISRATGDIDTENFNAVLRQMLDGYTNDHVNVIMNGLVQGFWNDIAPYKKVEIFRVLRELMTNMKKHSKATLVVVRFKKEGKTLVVSYVDNGEGVDFNQINYSNGLQNVENRIAGINGGIIFDSKPGKGFKAKITLT